MHVIFLCRQLVDFAVPFSVTIGGLGGTFFRTLGGLGGTFLETLHCDFWLGKNILTQDRGYAKVLFTNLIETKAGLSPDCLKENSKEGIGESLLVTLEQLTLQRKTFPRQISIAGDEREKWGLEILSLVGKVAEDLR